MNEQWVIRKGWGLSADGALVVKETAKTLQVKELWGDKLSGRISRWPIKDVIARYSTREEMAAAAVRADTAKRALADRVELAIKEREAAITAQREAWTAAWEPSR